VRADWLGDAGATGDPAHDACRPVAVEALPVWAEEQRSLAPFPNGEVDGAGCARCQRDGHDLATFAQDGQGPMAALRSERLDIGPGGF
jgi:hypothetical protein